MSFGFGNSTNTLGGGERKTGTLFGSTTAPAGGLFGQSQQQQQQQQPQQQAPAPGQSLFNTTSAQQNSLFGASQQQQQNAGSTSGISMNQGLGASQAQLQQQLLPQLRQTHNDALANVSSSGHREKSIVEQMKTLNDKWDPKNPKCAFAHYFYNYVGPDQAIYYGPQPHEDEGKWEEALSNKPGPGYIPVLAHGFQEMAARIAQQNLAVTALRTRLHEINNSLTLMKDAHELNVASRVAEARRKHTVFTQRTLALATKVQILRNRGYVMDQQEEELKKKLTELEKNTFDPVLGGRQEEIWARMSSVRERARILQEETEKLGKTVDSQQNGELLSEDDQKALEKLLRDYDRQLEHLKKWVDDTKEEYNEWEKERKPAAKSGR